MGIIFILSHMHGEEHQHKKTGKKKKITKFIVIGITQKIKQILLRNIFYIFTLIINILISFESICIMYSMHTT